MTYSRMTYLADGLQTSFRYGFKISDQNGLRVFAADPLDLENFPLRLNADYTVTGVGDDGGGTVELTAAGRLKAPAGQKLVIKKGLAYECEGGSPAPEVPAGVDFSFEEQWTGKYDLTDPDGPKKVYVKTIDCGTLTNPGSTQTDKSTPHGIDGLKAALSIGGIMTNSAGVRFIPLTYASGKSATMFVDDGLVTVRYISDWLGWQAKVTLEYTKND